MSYEKELFRIQIPEKFISSFNILSNEYEINITSSHYNKKEGYYEIRIDDYRDFVVEVINRCANHF